jgi:hypothetical protein
MKVWLSSREKNWFFFHPTRSVMNSFPQQQKRNQERTTHLCFEVNDINQMITRFYDHGFEVIEGPYILRNGWQTVFFEGPDHEILEFLEIGRGFTKE